jgi:hypothetical protein
MKIEAQVSILAQYTDDIIISVHDKTSSTTFLELVLSREQIVNAAMNRLAHCDVKSAEVIHPERIGKKMEMDTIHFVVPIDADADYARDNVGLHLPGGWVPDMSFGSQGSFYTKDGMHYAQTVIRRWV